MSSGGVSIQGSICSFKQGAGGFQVALENMRWVRILEGGGVGVGEDFFAVIGDEVEHDAVG